MKPNCRFCLLLVLLNFLAVLMAGCSSESSKISKYIASADASFLSGDYATAEIQYINALKLDNELTHAIARLGIIYFDQQRHWYADSCLRDANEQDPDNIEVAYRLALIKLIKKNSWAARAEALKIIEKDPQNRHGPILLMDSIKKEQSLQDFEKETLEKCESIALDNPSYKVAAGRRQARLGRTDEAKQLYRQALEIDANSSYAHFYLANMYLAEGDSDKAESAFIAAAKEAPVRSIFRLQLIDFYLWGHDVEKGRALLDETLESAPNLVPALVSRARLQERDDDLEATLKTVELILDLDPVHHDAFVMKGALLRRLGNAEEAIEVLSRVIKGYPKSYTAHFELAQAYRETDNFQRASASLTEALQLKPDFQEARTLLALLQLKYGRYDESILNFNQLIESNPDNPDLKIQLAAALRSKGEIETALKVYQELEAAFPENAQFPFLSGRIYIQLNDIPKAVAAFRESAKRDLDFLPALEYLTSYYVSEERFDDAIDPIESRIKANPGNAVFYVVRAKINIAQGDDDLAEASLLKAIELQSDYPDAYRMLVQLYLKNNSLDNALYNLQQMLENDPEDVRALMTMSMIYEQKSDLENARDTYEKILQVDPDFGLALNNLAYLYATKFDDLEQAEELAQKARNAYRYDPSVADTLGWIKYLRGDYEMARYLLKESSEKLINRPEILYHLGAVCYMLGDEIEARQAFELALTSDIPFNGKDDLLKRLEMLNIDSSDSGNLSTLEKIVAENQQDDPVAQVKLAEIYEQLGKNNAALQSYDKVLSSNVKNVTALMGKARILSVSEEPAQALEFVQKVRMLRSNDPEIAGQLGRIAFLAGDHALSAILLQQAMDGLNKDPQLEYHFAESLFANGRIDAARNLYERLDGENAQSLFLFLEIMGPTDPTMDFRKALSLANASDNSLAIAWAKALAAKVVSSSQGIAAFEELLEKFPEFTPAKKDLVVLYVMNGQESEAVYRLANEALRAFSDDPELKLALGILEFKRKNFVRAVGLLQAGNASDSQTAMVQFSFGMALNQSGKTVQSIKPLQRALELGLPEVQADEVKAVFAEMK